MARNLLFLIFLVCKNIIIVCCGPIFEFIEWHCQNIGFFHYFEPGIRFHIVQKDCLLKVFIDGRVTGRQFSFKSIDVGF